MLKVSFLKGKKEEGDKVLAAARVGGYRRQSPTLPLNASLRLILHEPGDGRMNAKGVCVCFYASTNMRGAMFMAMSSWKRSLHA